MADINFYFDPTCPFAWLASKWVRIVQSQRAYTVDWRFISLRLLNEHVDYATHFPPEYEASHTAGLRLLRVAAQTRASHGRDAVGPLYAALGDHAFHRGHVPDEAAAGGRRPTPEFVLPALADAGLPASLAEALDNSDWDTEIRAETTEALTLAGKDVGTPILHFQPPHGVAFFGPVISRVPDPAQAVELWDHVVGLATFPGFAELKRSLRELPSLPAFGVAEDEVGVEQDWHGGSRRTKK
jgi:2-hydroxychromene-2-carboxylate isomerase